MKVVLAKDVKGLGAAGDVREVSDGYARNYLLPRGLAVAATPQRLKELEARKEAEARRQAREEAQARELAQRLAATPIVLQAKVGEQHRLYGSITSADIAEALGRALGQQVDRRKIELEEPIRMVGSYTVPFRLARNIVTEITVRVEPETGGR